MENPDIALGRAAFEAYCLSVGGLTYDGKPIPGWSDPRMTQVVRDGWIAAALQIVKIIEDQAREEFLNQGLE